LGLSQRSAALFWNPYNLADREQAVFWFRKKTFGFTKSGSAVIG